MKGSRLLTRLHLRGELSKRAISRTKNCSRIPIQRRTGPPLSKFPRSTHHCHTSINSLSISSMVPRMSLTCSLPRTRHMSVKLKIIITLTGSITTTIIGCTYRHQIHPCTHRPECKTPTWVIHPQCPNRLSWHTVSTLWDPTVPPILGSFLAGLKPIWFMGRRHSSQPP